MNIEEEMCHEPADPVSAALEHVKRAEHDLEKARDLEREAERELRLAEEELRHAEEHRHKCVEVHVTHVNEVETVEFEVSREATLQAVWHESYSKLDVPHHQQDIFQTAGEKPLSLMDHLHLTLLEAKQSHIITTFHFEIVSETGGA